MSKEKLSTADAPQNSMLTLSLSCIFKFFVKQILNFKIYHLLIFSSSVLSNQRIIAERKRVRERERKRESKKDRE